MIEVSASTSTGRDRENGVRGAGDRETRQAGMVRTGWGWGKRGERRTEGESVKRAERGGGQRDEAGRWE